MFSKEENKRLRQEFWIAFGKSYPKKWILYNTKIKGLVLKFSFDVKKAYVSLDVEVDDLDRRIQLWEKLVDLTAILKEEFHKNVVLEDSFILENGKEISRVYAEVHNVSIYNKGSWQKTMIFFNENMQRLEIFFEEYKYVIDG